MKKLAEAAVLQSEEAGLHRGEGSFVRPSEY
jgi:hypothetical protein